MKYRAPSSTWSRHHPFQSFWWNSKFLMRPFVSQPIMRRKFDEIYDVSKRFERDIDSLDCSVGDVLELIQREKVKHCNHAKVSTLLARMAHSFQSLDKFSRGIDVLAQASSVTLVLWGSIRILLQASEISPRRSMPPKTAG